MVCAICCKLCGVSHVVQAMWCKLCGGNQRATTHGTPTRRPRPPTRRNPESPTQRTGRPRGAHDRPPGEAPQDTSECRRPRRLPRGPQQAADMLRRVLAFWWKVAPRGAQEGLPAPPPLSLLPSHPTLHFFSQRRPPDVWTLSLGPAFLPESFFDGPGARCPDLLGRQKIAPDLQTYPKAIRSLAFRMFRLGF